MLNGKHYNPTKIYIGREWLDQIVSENYIRSDRLLIVTGGLGTENSGALAEVLCVLERINIEYSILDGVQTNPKADLVYKGIEFCREHKSTKLLAIGGGSVVDTAKAIAIGTEYDGDFFDFFVGKSKVNHSLEVGVILTISGAGSESSDGAVISKGKLKYPCGSPLMYPKFALLEPSFTLTVPADIFFAGLVDSISHILERFFSKTNNTTVSDGLCISLMRTLIEISLQLKVNFLDLEVRKEFMWASKLAHDGVIGFGRKHDWATHTIAHEVASLFGTNHGQTLAVLFPAWMKWTIEKGDNERLKQISLFVFNGDPKLTSFESAESAVSSYERFLREMGMPLTLRQLTNRSDLNLHFDDIAIACSQTTASGTIGNYNRLSSQDVIRILELAEGV